METRNYVKLWLLALVVGAVLLSCRKDLNSISTSQWQPELAAPFINTNITLRNIIGSDTNLQTTPDSLLVYYYAEDSVFKLTADSVLQPPDEINYQHYYSLGEISVSDELFNDTLTMDEMLNSINDQIADSLRAYDGTMHIFPPFELEQAISDTFRASQEYAYLTFSDGTLDVSVTNTLPVRIEEVEMKIIDIDFDQELKAFNIPVIEPGQTFLDTIRLAGKTIGNEFLIELTYYKTPGSFPQEVFIDLQQGLVFNLLIDDAKVIAGRGKITKQIVVNDTSIIEYKAEEGEKLFHILFGGGTIHYKFVSGLPVDADVEIQFPTALKDGEIPDGEFFLEKGGTVEDETSLEGLSIDFTEDPSQPYNRFPVTFKITLLPTDDFVTIDSSDNVDAIIDFTQIDLAYADGYLGRKEVNISRDTVETGLSWLDQLKGEIILTEPVIEIKYTNGIGVPLKILPEIYGFNSNTGESQGLDSDTIIVSYPTQPGDITQGNFEYNNSNSSLVELIALRPDMIIYDGHGLTNWNESEFNFVFDTSMFVGNAEVKIPLIMKSNFFAFSDTVKIKVDESDNSLKEGLMIANVLNGFPFEMHMQLKIPDSVTGEILETIDFGMVESAIVDAEGKVTEPVPGQLTGAFDENFMTNLSYASYALIYVESATFDNGKVPVALHSDYVLKTAIGFQLKVQP